MKYCLVKAIVILYFTCPAVAQQQLTLAQQQQDFEIFKGALNEGHAGLYYFIEKRKFEQQCDSIQQTFKDGLPVDDFYLKLRLVIASLRHGHTSVNLPTPAWIDYKMGVLDSTKLYLPFQLLITNGKLFIKEDCSKEQHFRNYSVVKKINGIKATDLIKKMLPYMPADGINETFKYYSLHNYFYFHHLFSLLFPSKQGVNIELEKNAIHYYVELLKPRTIDSIYFAKKKQSISSYGKQLVYQSNVAPGTAYLKIGSFFKGLIENNGQQYVQFLDSCFAEVNKQATNYLIVDLRDNEGGGDGYDNILVAYLLGKREKSKLMISVPSKNFSYTQYASFIPDDFKMYIENPSEFLRDDSSLFLKDKYVDMMREGFSEPTGNAYKGSIIVLTNGGSFSASTSVISSLYYYRKTTARKILFIGEENGGDIYCGTGCSGQSYIIKLPASNIQIAMPILCFGELKKNYPKKRLPDYEVYPTPDSLRQNKDVVLEYALKVISDRR
jgi:hypothetical protein